MSRTEELLRGGAERRTPEAARELVRANFAGEVDPYQKIEDLRQIGKKKAMAEGVAYQLEQERKIVLARVGTELARIHAKAGVSESKLERLALASPTYQDHIKGLAAAVEQREYLRSEYWAVKSELEWDRAALAHLNALSRLEE